MTDETIPEQYARHKRALRAMRNPDHRWNYICDNTPETNYGCTMAANLLTWAQEHLKGGVTVWKPKEDLVTAVRERGDALVMKVTDEDEEWLDKQREAHEQLDAFENDAGIE